MKTCDIELRWLSRNFTVLTVLPRAALSRLAIPSPGQELIATALAGTPCAAVEIIDGGYYGAARGGENRRNQDTFRMYWQRDKILNIC